MQTEHFIFDAHTHLQDFQEDQIAQVLKESIAENVRYIVVNSVDISYLPQILTQQAIDLPKIIPCIGLHPWFIPSQIDISNYFQPMEDLLKSNAHVQVGEIGLDFKRSNIPEDKHLQMEVFKLQLEMTHKYNKVCSVHCVRAHGELLKIFKQFFKGKELKEAIIMHSYGGSKEITQSLDKLYGNFYYSLSMNVINRLEILDYIDIDKLLVETDSPHQFNGKVLQKQRELKTFNNNNASEPRFINDLISVVSQYLKIDQNKLQQILMANFLRAFKNFI